MTKKKSNKDFMVFSAICILFVVDIHSGGGVNLLSKIFPYDSFFMPAFIFISGYFFKKPNNIKDTIYFIVKKSKRLLIPFYKYNIYISIIWVIISIFVSNKILSTNSMRIETNNFDIISFVVDKLIFIPFSYGTPFDLISPSWFLISLWGTICCYTLVTFIFKSDSLISEIILLIVLVASGLFSIILSKMGYSNCQEFILILKILFFLPFFQLGHIFSFMDRNNILNEVKYGYLALLSLFINSVLLIFYSDFEISFVSLAFMQSFKNSYPIIPLVTGFTGICFYLYISKMIAKHWGDNYIINQISENTLAILCIHIFVFNLLNLFFFYMKTHFNCFMSFNSERFLSSAWYIYAPHVGFSLIYFTLGIFIPLMYMHVINKSSR